MYSTSNKYRYPQTSMMHGLLEYPDGGIESMVRTVSEGILNLNLVDHVPLGTTGEGNQKGGFGHADYCNFVNFSFSTRFFVQIVENRETQLSSPFLGPGDNFFEKL